MPWQRTPAWRRRSKSCLVPALTLLLAFYIAGVILFLIFSSFGTTSTEKVEVEIVHETTNYDDLTKFLASKTVSETRELVEQILDKFDNDEVVSIRGFFSSGTNWLRALLRRNCQDMVFEYSIHPPFLNGTSLDVDGLYGWKHGLFLEKERNRLSARSNHSLVIISREAPTWVVSAWKMFAMADAPKAKSPKRSSKRKARTHGFKHTAPPRSAPPKFTARPQNSKTLRGAWGDLRKYIEAKVDETGIHAMFFQTYYDKDIREQYRLRCPNVLAARTLVYRNWMQLVGHESLRDQVHFLRYGDLQANPYSAFRDMIDKLGVVSCNVSIQNFDVVSTRIKMGHEDRTVSFKDKHPREEFCSAVESQSLYEVILSKIDRKFDEQVLGYVYPDSRDEYCQGV